MSDARLSSGGRLVGVLSDQVKALRVAVYRHRVITMLLAVADFTYLARAVDEAESASTRLAELDVLRAMAVAEVGCEWGVEDIAPTLTSLLIVAPPETAERLSELRDDARLLLGELEELRILGRKLTEAAEGAVRERLENLMTADLNDNNAFAPVAETESVLADQHA